jgi:putative ABC transport system permease protein
MRLLRLSLANLAMSPLTTAVNILLLTLGTASIAILLIAAHQLTTTLTRDAADIDLVIGAKGSPLQLILSGVYHADVPPGNIPLSSAKPWMKHPLVESAIPLALGDSFEGFRIVGTTQDYLKIYGGRINIGELWGAPLEIVAGSQVAKVTGLGLDSTFSGVHGLNDGGHMHDEERYRIVGVLEETGTVLDRLLITSMESVWALHGSHNIHSYGSESDDEHMPQENLTTIPEDKDHHHDEAEHNFDDGLEHATNEYDEHEPHQEDNADHNGKDITVLLVKYASPLAAISLPRDINAESALQAASPAFEITRLLQIVGIGIGWLQAFAGILLASAAVSIFAALYASLKARRHDLAVLRCLGASRSELFYLIFVEGVVLTTVGIFGGLIVAHGGLELVGNWLANSQQISLTGWVWAPTEFLLVVALLIAGFLTALIPAWQAFSTDVAKTLSTGS